MLASSSLALVGWASAERVLVLGWACPPQHRPDLTGKMTSFLCQRLKHRC